MSKTVENLCLKLMELGLKVRAWIRSEGIILRIIKDGVTKWFLLVDNKIAAVL